MTVNIRRRASGLVASAAACVLSVSVCAGQDVEPVEYVGTVPLSGHLERIQRVNPEFVDVDVSRLDGSYVVYRSASCKERKGADLTAAAEAVVDADPGRARLETNYSVGEADGQTVTAFGSLTLHCPSGLEFSNTLLVLREDRVKSARTCGAYGVRTIGGSPHIEWPSPIERVSWTSWMSPHGIEFLGFLRSAGSDWAFAIRLPRWIAVVDLSGKTVFEGRIFSDPVLARVGEDVDVIVPAIEPALDSDLAGMPGDTTAVRQLQLAAAHRWNLRRIGRGASEVLGSSLVRGPTSRKIARGEIPRSEIPVVGRAQRLRSELAEQGKLVRY